MATVIEYTCANCKDSFVSERSDEEAERESEEIFGIPVSDDTHSVICDDCYRKLGLWVAEGKRSLIGFDKNIEVQASEQGGADWFPYGHRVSLRTMLAMFRDKDLSIESVQSNIGIQIFACEEQEGVDWVFWLPSCSSRLLEHLGWFKKVEQ